MEGRVVQVQLELLLGIRKSEVFIQIIICWKYPALILSIQREEDYEKYHLNPTFCKQFDINRGTALRTFMSSFKNCKVECF